MFSSYVLATYMLFWRWLPSDWQVQSLLSVDDQLRIEYEEHFVTDQFHFVYSYIQHDNGYAMYEWHCSVFAMDFTGLATSQQACTQEQYN